MLETLVSSRIRRTLFEHILIHPGEPFYLRGLAKQLNLSVSPLRRELKRLERSGMLRAVQEGNLVFYAVNTDSTAFLQLKQAGLPAMAAVQTGRPTEAPSQEPLGAQGSPAPALAKGGPGGLRVIAPSPQPPAPSQAAIPIGIVSANPKSSRSSSPLSGPALVGAAGVGMALMLILAGIAYLSLIRERQLAQISHHLSTRQAEVTIVVPSASTSGVMKGRRWQIVPGGFGGFSSGSSGEAY